MLQVTCRTILQHATVGKIIIHNVLTASRTVCYYVIWHTLSDAVVTLDCIMVFCCYQVAARRVRSCGISTARLSKDKRTQSAQGIRALVGATSQIRGRYMSL